MSHPKHEQLVMYMAIVCLKHIFMSAETMDHHPDNMNAGTSNIENATIMMPLILGCSSGNVIESRIAKTLSINPTH